MTFERVWLMALTSALNAFAIRTNDLFLMVAGLLGFGIAIICSVLCLWRWMQK